MDDSVRGDNESALASFCQEETDRQQKLFLKKGFYEQVWPKKLTDTLEVEVHIYRGMKGQGFVIVSRELRDDGWWGRQVSVGPENREKEWRKSIK